jgi:hypothetical protein
MSAGHSVTSRLCGSDTQDRFHSLLAALTPLRGHVERIEVFNTSFVSWLGEDLRSLGLAFMGPGVKSIQLKYGKPTQSLWRTLPEVVQHLPSLEVLNISQVSITVCGRIVQLLQG